MVSKQILLMAYSPRFIPITVQFKTQRGTGGRHARANTKKYLKISNPAV